MFRSVLFETLQNVKLMEDLKTYPLAFQLALD